MKQAGHNFLPIVFVLLCFSGPALGQGCPENAHVDRVQREGDVRTFHCVCNDGYEKSGGQCVPVLRDAPRNTPPRAAAPPRRTIMRAQTRPECVRGAETRLHEKLQRCDSPWLACLKAEAARDPELLCIGAALLATLPLVGRRVKATGAMIAIAGLGVGHSCTRNLKAFVDACTSAYGRCEAGPARDYARDLQDCPAR